MIPMDCKMTFIWLSIQGWEQNSSVPQAWNVKGCKHPQTGWKQSQLKGREEVAEVNLLKSIFHSASTNMLHSDWGQSDRQAWAPPPSSPSVASNSNAPAVRCLSCSGFTGAGLVIVGTYEECAPSFTDGDAISAGAVGGYQGDSSTSTLSRWILRHCHLLAKARMCHTKLGVLPRD